MPHGYKDKYKHLNHHMYKDKDEDTHLHCHMDARVEKPTEGGVAPT